MSPCQDSICCVMRLVIVPSSVRRTTRSREFPAGRRGRVAGALGELLALRFGGRLVRGLHLFEQIVHARFELLAVLRRSAGRERTK